MCIHINLAAGMFAVSGGPGDYSRFRVQGAPHVCVNGCRCAMIWCAMIWCLPQGTASWPAGLRPLLAPACLCCSVWPPRRLAEVGLLLRMWPSSGRGRDAVMLWSRKECTPRECAGPEIVVPANAALAGLVPASASAYWHHHCLIGSVLGRPGAVYCNRRTARMVQGAIALALWIVHA
jgi:hypothetical protein